MTGRHARRDRPVTGHAHRAAEDRAGGAEMAGAVRELQRRCGRWLVIWSPWRRAYTGFACFTREPLIIDETRADRFLDRVRRIELALAPVKPVFRPGPAAPAPQEQGRGGPYRSAALSSVCLSKPM